MGTQSSIDLSQLQVVPRHVNNLGVFRYTKHLDIRIEFIPGGSAKFDSVPGDLQILTEGILEFSIVIYWSFCEDGRKREIRWLCNNKE